MRLNYKKMVEDILEEVENDWCAEMELKAVDSYASEYSQEEAKLMALALAKVYGIAHCSHCKACNIRYIIKTK